MRFGYYEDFDAEASDDEGSAGDPLSSPASRTGCSPIKPFTNRTPTQAEVRRAHKCAREQARIKRKCDPGRELSAELANMSLGVTARAKEEQDFESAREKHLAFRRTLMAKQPVAPHETQQQLTSVQQVLLPYLAQEDAAAQKVRQQLEVEFRTTLNEHQKSIEAALRILEERERKERERLEAEKRRKEEAARAVQQAKEEAERKAAADALAKQEADAEARRQAAEAAARKADEQRATEAKEAQDAANQAAAQAAQQSTAQAAAAMSKFMPDEVMEKAKERMALIDSIKADLKPLFKSGTNSNMTNAVFKAKMTFTRRLGQVMNSQKKIIEIAKDIDQVLKGAKSVSSEAYRLCMDILAKQIIKQCENEVAVKMDTAFPLAILCIMLYNAHPDFLDILLGKMSKRCPYVVPYFPARLKGESDDDFRLKLGYRKIVEWETRAQYAERMGGILALYAAIVQTDSVPHIHGIDFAWIWLSRMLNMKPRRVSPGLILRFLEMAGSQFLPRFGKQAEKMIVYIRDVYMPMIPADAVAAATRLQLFLDDVCKTGRVPVPEGRSLLP